MSHHIIFSHPEPQAAGVRIWPVFLPFAGCPHRCVFCAQEKQTGRDETDLAEVLRGLEADLEQVLADGRGPYEIAFYGGTFTALPSPWPEAFLALATRFRERGLITRIRCSTRPDCVDHDGLVLLRGQGLDMVELGIQSFDDAALQASGRGYTGETARVACDLVKEAGLALGVQLLPGLPGDRPGVFVSDVRRAADLRPEVARLYPCLVIRDTRLAELWERGGYAPWAMNRAKRELAEALPVLWAAEVRVIRLGLPQEGTLEGHILAGPWHPALGQSVRGLALMEMVRRKVAELGRMPLRINVPRRYSGELYGHGLELRTAYAEMGLPVTSVSFVDGDEFLLS